MTDIEARKLDAEIARLIAESVKLNNEARKMVAETGQIKIQTILAPFLAAAAVIGATAAVVKLFF